MDKLRKWYRDHFTTQFRIYAVLLLVAIVTCFLASLQEVRKQEIFIGIGSGMIASVAVAILVDYGNTKLQHEKAKQQA